MSKGFAHRLSGAMLSLLLILAGVAPTFAGGALEQIDITGREPSPIPGQLVARIVGIKWDARTLPVVYSMNDTLDPIPNPLGAPFLTVAQAKASLQAALDAWNNIPTSYIEMRIGDRTYSNPKTRGFDMVNELTFRTDATFSAIASSPSTSLIEDSLLEDGDDLDLDGDSDVSAAITTAQDVDNDGDTEFPAGFYKAGTILDNDVQFNTKTTTGLRFTTEPGQIDPVTRSVDLFTTSVHEFGHSHGLSHTLINQLRSTDGTAAIMFPLIDTGDPASELAGRTLEDDDIAYSSYFYPEGSAASGPAALQSGDVAFSDVFSLIEGDLRHGYFDEPIAGGSLFAIEAGENPNTALVSAYSGHIQLSLDPRTGGLFLIDPSFNIIDGRYVLPVRKGSYHVGVEAVDGLPVGSTQVNFTTQIGDLFGQQNFNEEFYNGGGEAAREDRPGERAGVAAATNVSGIDITTNRVINLSNFGTRDAVGFGNASPGFYYAVRIPASQIVEVLKKGTLVIQAGLFDTNTARASVIPTFAEATLTTGVVNPNGTATVNLASPLARTTGFLGQDNDFSNFYFDDPRALGQTVRAGVLAGTIKNLFLLLRVPTTAPFPGGVAPRIGLDGFSTTNDVPIFPLSYVSLDGTSFVRETRGNFRFSLALSEPVR